MTAILAEKNICQGKCHYPDFSETSIGYPWQISEVYHQPLCEKRLFMFIGASVLTGALKLHNTYCYLFPTGFELTRGYWTDHSLNHKQSPQIFPWHTLTSFIKKIYIYTKGGEQWFMYRKGSQYNRAEVIMHKCINT